MMNISESINSQVERMGQDMINAAFKQENPERLRIED
jgi:hypothetical protein